MIVLSLFDGMSCGMIALERAGIKVDKYYSSEIDKYAEKVSQKNYPNIIRLGDVNNWRNWDLGKVDLIIGGSPCQGFSFAGKQLAFDDPRSKLFFTMVEIINHYKPKYFLLENVKMKKEYQDVITQYMGVNPIEINSSLVSAQNRKRLYRTNIPGVKLPNDRGIMLKDILEEGVDEKYNISEKQRNALKKYESNSRLSPLFGKSYTLNTMQGGHRQPKILTNINPSGNGMNGNIYFVDNKSPTITTNKGEGIKIVIPEAIKKGFIDDFNGYKIRKLTPTECSRLQTVPDNYFNSIDISNSQKYKMLGNGWTVDVIAHIFTYIK